MDTENQSVNISNDLIVEQSIEQFDLNEQKNLIPSSINESLNSTIQKSTEQIEYPNESNKNDSDWILYYTAEGYPYYFNSITGESQWAEWNEFNNTEESVDDASKIVYDKENEEIEENEEKNLETESSSDESDEEESDEENSSDDEDFEVFL
jgi:hypothetical protein